MSVNDIVECVLCVFVYVRVLFRVQRAAAPKVEKIEERIEYVDKIEYKEVGMY